MKTKTYEGLLSLHSHGEAYNVLFINSLYDPLAEELEWVCGKSVTIRYWITDKQVTKEEAHDEFLKQIMGSTDVKFLSRYSDITGYLWTDEDLNVGGHDLIAELKCNAGKWLILEIEY